MNKNYLIYFSTFVLLSISAHSTDQLVFYSMMSIFVNNLLEHRASVFKYITIKKSIEYAPYN